MPALHVACSPWSNVNLNTGEVSQTWKDVNELARRLPGKRVVRHGPNNNGWGWEVAHAKATKDAAREGWEEGGVKTILYMRGSHDAKIVGADKLDDAWLDYSSPAHVDLVCQRIEEMASWLGVDGVYFDYTHQPVMKSKYEHVIPAMKKFSGVAMNKGIQLFVNTMLWADGGQFTPDYLASKPDAPIWWLDHKLFNLPIVPKLENATHDRDGYHDLYQSYDVYVPELEKRRAFSCALASAGGDLDPPAVWIDALVPLEQQKQNAMAWCEAGTPGVGVDIHFAVEDANITKYFKDTSIQYPLHDFLAGIEDKNYLTRKEQPNCVKVFHESARESNSPTSYLQYVSSFVEDFNPGEALVIV